MNSPSVAMPGTAADARELAPAAAPRTRPLYWSVRRELWENRSIYLAPLGVSTFAVVALVIHALTMPSHMPGMVGNDPGTSGSAAAIYSFVTFLMLVTAFIVGAFYSLEALSSERRDRSILFWKSLPVSDLTTVLAKAGIPLVILPLATFAAVLAAHLAMLLLSALALLIQGESVAPLWRDLQLLRMWPGVLYALVAIALWHAPIYGFLLMVSGWARRTAVLWAVLPLLALGLLEKLTMDTGYVLGFVTDRVLGWHQEGFAVRPRTTDPFPFDPLAPLTPARFLGTPGLWVGLVFAAVFLAAAVRLRRYREAV